MYRNFVKRLFGIFFSIISLPALFVVYVVVAPIIKLEDKGPVFYMALRLGRYGRLFKMYKFRSMKVNAPDLRNADGTTFNSKTDSRVTKVGHFLRKTSLDELPQILNVLKGDMAFIGPRPDMPGADKTVYRPGDEVKLTVRPGITGYSQAYYRNSSNLKQRFDGDVFYAKHVSFFLDLRILLKTVRTVVKRRNIYRN